MDSGASWIVEWLWVPLWAAVFELFRRYFGMNERVSKLEALEQQRSNNHVEAMTRLNSHNDAVIGEVRTLAEQVKSNGRRLGTIEGHLINRKD